jgi:hypothetical protein
MTWFSLLWAGSWGLQAPLGSPSGPHQLLGKIAVNALGFFRTVEDRDLASTCVHDMSDDVRSINQILVWSGLRWCGIRARHIAEHARARHSQSANRSSAYRRSTNETPAIKVLSHSVLLGSSSLVFVKGGRLDHRFAESC